MTSQTTHIWRRSVIDQERLYAIKDKAVELVNTHHGLKSNDLFLSLMGEFPNEKDDYMARAISELVQDLMLVRVEFIIPNYNSAYFTFYLPSGSRIV